VTEPTENNILNWKIWLALPAMKSFMEVFANRTFIHYHDDLDGMVTPNGVTLSLNDPAIDAFLDLLPFRFSDNYTLSSICMAIGRTKAAKGSFDEFEDDLPAIQRLTNLKVSGGLGNLDELFMMGWGRTFSSFFDGRTIFCTPDDTGLGGTECFRVQLLCGEGDPNQLALSIDWFAAASTPDHLASVLKRIVAGEFAIKLRKKAALVEIIQVLKGNDLVLIVPVSHSTDPKNQGTASNPMTVRWDKCVMLNPDPGFVKAMADCAPKQEGTHLKGRFLEDSLGL
jgi:hypothetical protein